jgi:hypothetical protein
MSEKMKPSVERAAHDAFRALAVSIWKAHGVKVLHVEYDWIDLLSSSHIDLMLQNVEIRSVSNQMRDLSGPSADRRS